MRCEEGFRSDLQRMSQTQLRRDNLARLVERADCPDHLGPEFRHDRTGEVGRSGPAEGRRQHRPCEADTAIKGGEIIDRRKPDLPVSR
jgi:hypothetical protein